MASQITATSTNTQATTLPKNNLASIAEALTCPHGSDPFISEPTCDCVVFAFDPKTYRASLKRTNIAKYNAKRARNTAK